MLEQGASLNNVVQALRNNANKTGFNNSNSNTITATSKNINEELLKATHNTGRDLSPKVKNY